MSETIQSETTKLKGYRFKSGEYFTPIPHAFLEKGFSGEALKLFLLLSTYQDNGKHTCYPTRETLADGMGKSTRTITTLIQELQRVGVLEVSTRKSKGSKHNNVYKLLYTEDETHEPSTDVKVKNTAPVGNSEEYCTSKSEINCTTNSEINCTLTNNHKTNIQLTNNQGSLTSSDEKESISHSTPEPSTKGLRTVEEAEPTHKRSYSAQELDEGFEAFWSNYPEMKSDEDKEKTKLTYKIKAKEFGIEGLESRLSHYRNVRGMFEDSGERIPGWPKPKNWLFDSKWDDLREYKEGSSSDTSQKPLDGPRSLSYTQVAEILGTSHPSHVPTEEDFKYGIGKALQEWNDKKHKERQMEAWRKLHPQDSVAS